MSEWTKLCSRAELPAEGSAKEFDMQGKTLCVAMIEGKPLALDNECPHRGGPLSEGTIEGGKVVCPWHQFEFDMATGAAADSSGLQVAAYPLRENGEDVLVKI